MGISDGRELAHIGDSISIQIEKDRPVSEPGICEFAGHRIGGPYAVRIQVIPDSPLNRSIDQAEIREILRYLLSRHDGRGLPDIEFRRHIPARRLDLGDFIITLRQIGEGIQAVRVGQRRRLIGISAEIVVEIQENGPARQTGISKLTADGIGRPDPIAIEIVPDRPHDLSTTKVEEIHLVVLILEDRDILRDRGRGSPAALHHFAHPVETGDQVTDHKIAIDIGHRGWLSCARRIGVQRSAVVEIQINRPSADSIFAGRPDSVGIDVIVDGSRDSSASGPLQDICDQWCRQQRPWLK